MEEKKEAKVPKTNNPDWFVQGALARIGDIFDRLTGRGWTKASSLSATELTEKLKALLDAEVKDLGGNRRFVPHNIKLKMQWNKFSTDEPEALKKLEYELLAAAVDHINDNLYHTYKPLKIIVKPDYFTDGVSFFASFDEFGEDASEAEVNVTVPTINVSKVIAESVEESYLAAFTVEFEAAGKLRTQELKFTESRKRMSVGRTKENDLMIDDQSISKVHASLVLNPQGKLVVADTGSTNGTFINGDRIAYGRAFAVNDGDKLKFGTVDIFLRRVPEKVEFGAKEEFERSSSETEPEQPEVAQSIRESSEPTVASFSLPPEVVHDTSSGFVGAPKNQETESEHGLSEPRVKLNFDD